MKKALLIFIFVFANISLLVAQQISLGVKDNILISNKYIEYQLNPRVLLEYKFENLPLSLSGNLGFNYAELSTENNLSASYTKTTSSLGAVINYFPVKWDIEPFVGVGIYYDLNNLSKSGNSSEDSEGKIYEANGLENNISYQLNAGFKFAASTSIHFVAEAIYSFSKPGYTLKVTNALSAKEPYVESEEEFDFNALYLSLGLMFDL